MKRTITITVLVCLAVMLLSPPITMLWVKYIEWLVEVIR